MTNKHREKEIPQEKIEKVDKLASKLKDSNSVVIVSIKSVPAKQLQQISKKLRGEAEMKVYKNSIASRGLEKAGGKVEELESYLRENIAFLFSELGPFELAAKLNKNKSKARAKEGQKVNEEVVIQGGPTEMTPGPVISELGELGIQFEIKEGKINIKENKKLLDEGDVAGPGEVSIMAKLDIKPVEITLTPLVAYDSENDEIFESMKVDEDEAKKDIKSKYSNAIAFAVSIGNVCKETISHLLAKAASHERAINDKVDLEEDEGESEEKEKDREGEKKGEDSKGDNREKEKEKEEEKKGDEGEGEEEEKKEGKDEDDKEKEDDAQKNKQDREDK